MINKTKKYEDKKQKNIRKSLLALLLMLSFVLTTGTFAYWANEVEGISQEAVGTLTIGSADAVDTTFDITNELNSGGLLVPHHQLENSGLGVVSQIDLSYDVQWLEDEIESQLQGTVTTGLVRVSHVLKIEIYGQILNAVEYAEIYDLITVKYDERNVSSLTLDAEAETFNFYITMNEPINQEQYNLISKANISITFTYQIVAPEITLFDATNN